MKLRKILFVIGIIAVIICLLPVLVPIFLIGGSDFTTYPAEKATVWVCEDPHFQISFTQIPSENYIEWEGETILVEVGLHSSAINIWRKIPGEDILKQENILIQGYWKYVGDTMVLEVGTDNIFDGAYTELVFIPQK